MAVRARAMPARRGAQARAPRLRVVEGARSRRLSVIGVFVLVLTVFAVAAVQAYVGQQGMRMSDLERKVAHAEEELTLLRARQAQLSAPSRLADEADELGLVADPKPTYLRVEAPKPSPDPTTEIHAAKKLLTPHAP